MTSRWIPTFFFLTGFCFLGLAVYGYFSPDSGFSLEVAQPELELQGCQAGEKRAVLFHLRNHSIQPMRVLGLSGTCGLNCCCGPTRHADAPKELPAGASNLRLYLEVRKAGEFRSEVLLWVEDQGAREVVLTVHGVAHDSPTSEKRTGNP